MNPVIRPAPWRSGLGQPVRPAGIRTGRRATRDTRLFVDATC